MTHASIFGLPQLTLTDTTTGFTRDGSGTAQEFKPRHLDPPMLGSHEVLLMTPELTAVKGNFGSLFLLFPA